MPSVTVHITSQCVCEFTHHTSFSPSSPSTPPHMYLGHGMWLVVDLPYGKSTTNLWPRHVWPFHTVLGYSLMQLTACLDFYCAMLHRARLRDCVSSACPSVTIRYHDHRGWNSSIIISPPNSDNIVMWRFLHNRRLILRLCTIFRALIYWAHHVVTFAIAWLLVQLSVTVRS